MSSKEYVKVGEELTLNYGKSLPARDRITGQYEVVGSNGVVDRHNQFAMEGPGIVVGRKGSVGALTWLANNFWAIDTTYYASLNGEGDLKYWYYQLSDLKLDTLNSHAAVPGLNRDNVYRIEVLKRSRVEQEKIAKILGDLDRKIELNRQKNETLEQIGQTLFKKHFVDNSESEGWDVKPLDEVADYKNGLACQKYPVTLGEKTLKVIKIKEMSSGFTLNSDHVGLDFPDDYIIENGDLLFAWSGTLMTKIWTEGPGALNQHIFKVTSNNYPKWFYYQWTNEHLKRFKMIAKSKAVTMGHIKRSHLSEVNVKIPPKVILDRFDKTFTSLLERQVEVMVENNNLISLRDSLLPKLLSGQIEL